MKLKSMFVASLTLLAVSAFAHKDPGTLQGKPMPTFSMTDSAGKKYTNASLKGKVVLIDFWATWCPPCRAATPSLQKLHAKYGKKGLVVLGADTFERSPEAKKSGAAAFAKQMGLTYTMTLNNDAYAEKLGIEGIPTLFLIDKKGKIHKVNVGWEDAEGPALDAEIAKLLKG